MYYGPGNEQGYIPGDRHKKKHSGLVGFIIALGLAALFVVLVSVPEITLLPWELIHKSLRLSDKDTNQSQASQLAVQEETITDLRESVTQLETEAASMRSRASEAESRAADIKAAVGRLPGAPANQIGSKTKEVQDQIDDMLSAVSQIAEATTVPADTTSPEY